MKPKVLVNLLVVTGVLVLVAAIVPRLGKGPAKGELPERLLPTLKDRINDITSITVTSGGQSTIVERRDKAWVIPAKGAYPARFETVKEALLGLDELVPLEAKTANPELYARIGVQEPGEGAPSTRLTLANADGAEIASVILGDEVVEGGDPKRYARVAGQDRAFLAAGRVHAPIDPMAWIDTELLRIGRDRVSRITIRHPDGETIELVRDATGANYTLQGVPEGREPKTPGEISAAAGSLNYLRFEDVRSMESPGFELDEPVLAAYELSNGVRLMVTLWAHEGMHWASFEAEGPAAPIQPTDASPTEDPSTAGEPTTDDPTAEARKEAGELNAKLRGWVFSIPSYQAETMRKRMADLTQAPAASEDALPENPPESPSFLPTLDAADDPAPGEGGG